MSCTLDIYTCISDCYAATRTRQRNRKLRLTKPVMSLSTSREGAVHAALCALDGNERKVGNERCENARQLLDGTVVFS